MKHLPLVMIVVLSAALPLSAQQNELGVFGSMARLASASIDEPQFGASASIEFEPRIGYGISFNRYFGDHLSAEVAAQRLNADAEFRISAGGLGTSFDVGSTELMVYTAVLQWHFAASDARIAPYVGAGAALAGGTFEFAGDFLEPGEPTSVDFENETTFVVNAGIDVRLSPAFAIGVDAKYVPVEAVEEDGLEEEALDINPLVLAAGIKLRF